MTVPTLVRLGSGAGTRASADPYFRVVSGKPSARVSDTFQEPTGAVQAGIAAYKPGALDLLGYPFDEYCFLLEGTVVITPESGEAQTFAPGDAFLLPRGFKGRWDMPTGLKKYYVVFDPHAKAAQPTTSANAAR